jgi:[ribosomal protein S18]-alanine N-acetyltransferase
MVDIEKMSLSELDAVMAIENSVFPAPKTKEVIENGFSNYWLAKENGNIVGYIGFEMIIDEGHITNMAVIPEYRRKGIASKLLNHVFPKAKNFYLEVRLSNTAAQNLYLQHGFQIVGRRKKYYSDNLEDALIMRK